MNLSKQQITEIAKNIGLSYSVFAAFIEVESGGNGFDPETGKIIIQFEPHIFARELTARKIDHSLHSAVKGSRKYYTIEAKGLKIMNGVEGQAAEWVAFNTAFKIHKDSALLSTSIGLSQVMGFNYAKLGYGSVGEMWDAFKKGEYQQVQGMAMFIKNTPGLLRALTRKDWKTAAKLYNGSYYWVNKYDQKLERAYNRYTKL